MERLDRPRVSSERRPSELRLDSDSEAESPMHERTSKESTKAPASREDRRLVAECRAMLLRSSTTMSGGRGSLDSILSGELGGSLTEMSAELVVRALAPTQAAVVMPRLRREQVLTSADLACLDRTDLKELGLNMVERNRILNWARQTFPDVAAGGISYGGGSANWAKDIPATQGIDASKKSEPKSEQNPSIPRMESQPPSCRPIDKTMQLLSEMNDLEEDQLQHLDDVESRADFWCRLVMESGATSPFRSDLQHVDELVRRGNEAQLGDLRENVLEKFFDLSPERLKEVYESIDRDSDGRILKEELCEGLHCCELHGLDGAVEKVLSVVSRESGSLRLDEFQSVLTRLKLAQLLTASKYHHQPVAEMLTIMDYHALKVEERKMSLRDFFFGHRRRDLPMRWVHLRYFDLIVLLAITVKYQLHPLSVEDVIHQAPTKIDRYEGHYFVSIEHLEVISATNGLEPVKVRGSHVTIFTAGPPHCDTVFTVSQVDRSFQQDWPGDSQSSTIGTTESAWLGRLHKRLRTVRSRVREGRADFLMYVIIDLCTDDIRLVTRVYTARLSWLEESLQKSKINSEQGKLDWFNEVGIMRLQLAVVSRRLRGLQRILRRLADDPDLAQTLSGYLQDVADHINEAYEDAGHLVEKSRTLSAAYEHAQDRAQDEIQRQAAEKQHCQDERMNNMLFVLTIFTTAFTPLTFIAGIYGMNFQDKAGVPTIPELLVPHGYFYFVVFTLVYLLVSGIVGLYLWRRVRRRKAPDERYVMQPASPRVAGSRSCPTLSC